MSKIQSNISRRKFLKTGAGTAAGIAAGMGFYAWKVEPKWLEFTYWRLPIHNLPSHLVGKKFVQISDIHIGPYVDNDFLVHSFNQVKKLDPDFVAFTGDFVTWQGPEKYPEIERVLAKAPHGKLATVATLGNHDYGDHWKENWVANDIIQMLNNQKIDVLRNEIKSVNGLDVMGIDDFWGTNFQPKNATSLCKKFTPTICLSHNPDTVDLDVWGDFNGWTLSGHTHGGQCKPPFLPPPILPVENKNYVAGFYHLEDGRNLYINRGLGHSIKVRFNVRPEITVFYLVKAATT